MIEYDLESKHMLCIEARLIVSYYTEVWITPYPENLLLLAC